VGAAGATLTSTADPYAKASADHAQRHREATIDLGGGLTRIDAGEPIKAPGRTFKP
jgi:hypothetical protein